MSRRKWTPSTIVSTDVAVAPDGTVIAASSPAPEAHLGAPRRGTLPPCRFHALDQARDQVELSDAGHSHIQAACAIPVGRASNIRAR